MIKIRLSRYGSNKDPKYRVTVANSRAPRNGRFIEHIGYYDPMVKEKENSPRFFHLKWDRFDYWVSVGAQITERVATLIKRVPRTESGSKKIVSTANNKQDGVEE